MGRPTHRPRSGGIHVALIARSVGKKEMLRIPEASEAVQKEFEKLLKQGALDLSLVEEWKDVRDRARADRREVDERSTPNASRERFEPDRARPRIPGLRLAVTFV